VLGSQRIACSGWEEKKIVVQIATLRRRPWADAAWLIIIIAAVFVALALGNTILLMAALIVAMLGGWLLLRGQQPALVAAQPVAANVGRRVCSAAYCWPMAQRGRHSWFQPRVWMAIRQC